MRKIGLIACSSKKKNKPIEAQYLYNSQLFKAGLKYLRSSGCHQIYILSAKYHVLKLTDIVMPYDLFLKKLNKEDKKSWNDKCHEQLIKLIKPEDLILSILGKDYEIAIEKLENKILKPTEGLTVGYKLEYYKKMS